MKTKLVTNDPEIMAVQQRPSRSGGRAPQLGMKVLLDHRLDWRLARSLPDHEVTSVGKLGWGQLKDNSLRAKAQARFDVLVTSDPEPGN